MIDPDSRTNFEKVKYFTICMNQTAGVWPPTEELRDLRWNLIQEERNELFNEFYKEYAEEYEGYDPSLLDKKAIAKEMADLLYVVYGAAVAFGIDLDQVFAAVHNSNMSKLGNDGKPIYREDGKVMKGPNYQPPQLEFIFK